MKTALLAVIVSATCMGMWAYAQQQGTADQEQVVTPSNQPSSPPSGGMSEPGATGQPGVAREPGMGSHQLLAPALIQSPNEMQIQGKVLSHKDASVPNDREHRMLRVQTKGGPVMEVDLGRKDRLPEGLNINDGQWVIVTGVRGQLNNQNVLVAHNLANVFNFTAEGSMPGGGVMGGSSGRTDKESKETSGDTTKDSTKDSTNTKDSSGY